MALVLLMRVCQARRQGGPLRYLFVSVALAGIALCAASYVLHAHQWVLLYPVVVNLVMLVVFGGSLWTAMPVVERLARLREPDLSPVGVRLHAPGYPGLVRLFHYQRGNRAVYRITRRYPSVDAVERDDCLSPDGHADGWRVAGATTGEEKRCLTHFRLASGSVRPALTTPCRLAGRPSLDAWRSAPRRHSAGRHAAS